jgi:hypothetical protein
MHTRFNKKEKGMILSIDMANAFERLRHSFLFKVLHKYKFSPSFISWVSTCIYAPWIAPLVNGRSIPFFRATRGFRQVFPLSPLLYILMAESLSQTLNKAISNKHILRIKIVRGTKKLNHSQFADDTLLISEASTVITHRFKSILDLYMDASSGLINKVKSQLFTWNTHLSLTISIATIFGFQSEEKWSYFIYLGMPLRFHPPSLAS